MSMMIEGIDARGNLIGWLKGLVGMTAADIRAIPEDKWMATFGGCTRPANMLLADALELMIWTAETLKTGEPAAYGDDESLGQLAAECRTRDVAIAKFSAAADDLASAIAGASDEMMSKVVKAPWGMDAPLYMIAQITVSHIWYHDGQFNYVQCLLGDDKIHWMGEQP